MIQKLSEMYMHEGHYVSVQYNSGFVPDIILSTLCYISREEISCLQPMFPPTFKRFDNFPPDCEESQKV